MPWAGHVLAIISLAVRLLEHTMTRGFLFVALVQCVLVAAQNSLNLTGFGGAHELGEDYSIWAEAAANPAASNRVSFQGFDFSPIRDPLNPPPTQSTNNWTLQLNYSTVTVEERGEQLSASNIVLDLELPTEELPIGNETDWQLCVSITWSGVPANVSDIEGGNDGDCTPYLGEECYQEYLTMAQVIRSSAAGCPVSPAILDMPACVARFGTPINSFAAGVSLMNQTLPNVGVHSNGTYYNGTTGETIENPTFTGLQSGVPFAYHAEDLPANPNDNATSRMISQQRSTQIKIVEFSLKPSADYLENLRHQDVSYQTLRNDVRLICARPNGTATGTESPPGNGGVSLRSSSVLASVMAVAVGVVLF